MTTGVFFHDIFVGKRWPIVGDRYRDFPDLLERLSVEVDDMKIIKPKPVNEKLLSVTHEGSYFRQVKERWYYEGATITVGGCVEASKRVWEGELDNAVVFLVAAGHHAHPDHAWGGTYISCIEPIIHELRSLGLERIAYLDTDSHHGDGARAIMKGDKKAFHGCFCGRDIKDEEDTKICVKVSSRSTDDEYLRKVEETLPRIEDFDPELLVHFFGHDTHMNDYGNRGLTKEFFVSLADLMKEFAKKICGGNYVVIDGGGANIRVGRYIWPKIIQILADGHRCI